EDVQRHLEHQPVLARPPSQVYRLRKMVRRHKVAFAAGTAVVVLAPLLAIGFMLLWPGIGRHRSAALDLQRAQQLLVHYDEEGHISEALDALAAAAKAEPGNPLILAKLGWANWLLHSEDEHDESRGEAYRFSSNALSINPHIAEAHLVQGLVRRSL